MFLARLGLSAVQNIFGSKASENDVDPNDILESLNLVRNCIDSHGLTPGLETEHLRRGVIQCTVDLMQDLFDHDESWKMIDRDPTDPNKLQIAQLLIQFSERFQIFPKSLFITVEPSSIRPQRAGTNSQIYSGQWKDLKVAITLLRSHGRSVRLYKNDPAHNKLFLECLRWRQLRHPNVVQLFGVDITNIGHAPTLIYPWIEKGNIRDHIEELTQKPELERLMSWLCDIARGMAYLHKMGIAHGDLRGNNILLSDGDNALVTDVVLYSFLEESTIPYPRKNTPERWMAPEFLNTSEPSYASDSYSFGLVCIEIFTGKIPFPDLSVGLVVAKMSEGDFPVKPDTMPDHVWSLARACWNYVPQRRPTMEQLLYDLSRSGQASDS